MRVLCVTSVKNEAPFILEWVAHHLAAGATDFLIFSNDCEDGTNQILQALDDAKVIVHVPQNVEPEQSVQWQALKAAWKHPLRKACEWAFVCDVDEFINIKTANGTIPELISTLPDDADGVVLPWRLFGNNGHAFFQDKPVTEQFTRSMSEDCSFPPAVTFFKSLFRLDGPFNQFGVHRPKQKSEQKSRLPVWYDGSGTRMPDAFARHHARLSLRGFSQGRDLVECHHYSLRSAESFLIKRARGLPNRTAKNIDLSYWIERNFNTIENASLLKTRPRTEEQMRKLMSISNIDKLHDDAVRWHREKFLSLMQSEAELRLFLHILVAGGSQSPPPDVTNLFIKWYRDIQQRQQSEAEN